MNKAGSECGTPRERPADAGQWTISEVKQWLTDVGKPAEAELFEKEGIDGDTLMALQPDGLVDIGIKKIAARGLVRKIQRLLSATSPAPDGMLSATRFLELNETMRLCLISLPSQPKPAMSEQDSLLSEAFPAPQGQHRPSSFQMLGEEPAPSPAPYVLHSATSGATTTSNNEWSDNEEHDTSAVRREEESAKAELRRTQEELVEVKRISRDLAAAEKAQRGVIESLQADKTSQPRKNGMAQKYKARQEEESLKIKLRQTQQELTEAQAKNASVRRETESLREKADAAHQEEEKSKDQQQENEPPRERALTERSSSAESVRAQTQYAELLAANAALQEAQKQMKRNHAEAKREEQRLETELRSMEDALTNLTAKHKSLLAKVAAANVPETLKPLLDEQSSLITAASDESSARIKSDSIKLKNMRLKNKRNSQDLQQIEAKSPAGLLSPREPMRQKMRQLQVGLGQAKLAQYFTVLKTIASKQYKLASPLELTFQQLQDGKVGTGRTAKTLAAYTKQSGMFATNLNKMWTMIRKLRKPEHYEIIAQAGLWNMYDIMMGKTNAKNKSGELKYKGKTDEQRLMNVCIKMFQLCDNSNTHSLDRNEFGLVIDLLSKDGLTMSPEQQKWVFEYIDFEPSAGAKNAQQEHLLLKQIKKRISEIHAMATSGKDRVVWPIVPDVVLFQEKTNPTSRPPDTKEAMS